MLGHVTGMEDVGMRTDFLWRSFLQTTTWLSTKVKG